MPDPQEYVELDVEVRIVTSKAIMISCEDADVDEQWIPRSTIDWDASTAKPERGSKGKLFVAEWFAEKEGLS